MTIRFSLIILIIFVGSIDLFSSGFSPEEDTITTIDSVNLTAGLELVDEAEQNPFILDMLDSLVNKLYFTNNEFISDTSVLNVYNFSPEHVPVYPDSVIQERLTELNKQTVFVFEYNKQIGNYIKLYAERRRTSVSKMLGLSEIYFPLFEEYLDKYNIPLELKYLPVVESALNPTAGSRAGAKGLWQFMYRTGKIYGLTTSSLVDDRFDPYKSTDAACRHLKDLYDIYGNWSLVLAAYNSGPGNVNKALRRAGGVKSYWAIWPYLPRETRGYVPAFIAVMYVMQHAAEHNLYPLRPDLFYEEIDTVVVNDVLSFDQISEMMNVPLPELQFLNPAYKMNIIPSAKDKKYVLRLHRKYIADYVDNEDSLYAYKTAKGIEKEKLLSEIKKAKERSVHIVKSGESLGKIANRYRCSVRNLRSWNNLRGNTIYPGQKLVLFAHGSTRSTKSTNTQSSNVSKNQLFHVVNEGENLGLIASRYKCKVDDLKKWNKLNSNTIKTNQKLLIYSIEKEEKKHIVTKSNNANADYIFHTVRRGDTLWDIAKLYDGVTIDQIKKLNNIRNSKRLKPGQKLKVAEKG